ncbi:MAG TPA: hypothetical protein VJM32_01805 [Candidatus Saccharimonadales bacterium]|nr:hypothetical protein [Candidatus Saccharimonadales bacterium]
MRRLTVAPSLVLDEEMYEAARAGLGHCAPDCVPGFTWEWFTARQQWRLIPDVENPDEPFFKAECVIKQEPPFLQTVKLNVWRSADLRRDGAPVPHSHPWPFRGRLLLGGYDEDRYTVQYSNRVVIDPYSPWDVGAVTVQAGVSHGTGSINDISLDTFHEVTRVHEPGRTLSLMDCDLGRKEGWGYLDPDTGLYLPNKQSPIDPRFKALLLARNPHLRR